MSSRRRRCSELGFARGNILAYEFMKRVQRPFAPALVNDDMIVNEGIMGPFVEVLREFGWVSGVTGVMR